MNPTTAAKSPRVGYFSMEVGIANDMKQYAGGLGILAGDTLKTAADMGVPVVGITLLYKHGYFRQQFDAQGIQQETADDWDYNHILTNTHKRIIVPLAGMNVQVEIWEYTLTGVEGHNVKLYFLNTDLPENPPAAQYVSYNLYTPYQETRLRQEIVLGIGGVLALKELGFGVLDRYHLNESHAAFAILALEELLGGREQVPEHVVFTTHTPAEHGHVQYQRSHLEKFLAPQHIERLDRDFDADQLHLTKFCLRNAKYSNAVAKRHGEVSRRMFPDFTIDSVTNGVHAGTWVAPATAALFDKYAASWRQNPAIIAQVANTPLEELRQMHAANKLKLIDLVMQRTGEILKPNLFTIGFARRVDGYKRSGLILHDVTTLRHIAQKFGGIQLVMSGKAYFDYGPAEELIAQIRRQAVADFGPLEIVYVEDYGIDVSKILVAGCDLWLNNPIKPLEASGTSGMKAALNGVPSFSTLDGWWVEGWEEGVTGWIIGSEDIDDNDDGYTAHDLYRKLEDVILPVFYNQPATWLEIQRSTIVKNGPRFNTHRMLQEYLDRGYQLASKL